RHRAGGDPFSRRDVSDAGDVPGAVLAVRLRAHRRAAQAGQTAGGRRLAVRGGRAARVGRHRRGAQPLPLRADPRHEDRADPAPPEGAPMRLLAFALALCATAHADKLPSRALDDLNWMEFQKLVPSQVSAVLLTVGTLEPHGVINDGADNSAPV